MSVPALGEEVDVGLVGDGDFMRAIAHGDAVGVNLVTVTEHYAMKLAREIDGGGVVRTISYSCAQQSALIIIYEAGGEVGSICRKVSAQERRSGNGEEWITQLEGVATGEIDGGVYLQFVSFSECYEGRIEMLH